MLKHRDVENEIQKCTAELHNLLGISQPTNKPAEDTSCETLFTNTWNTRYPNLKGHFAPKEGGLGGLRRFRFELKSLEHHRLLVGRSHGLLLLYLYFSGSTVVKWAALPGGLTDAMARVHEALLTHCTALMHTALLEHMPLAERAFCFDKGTQISYFLFSSEREQWHAAVATDCLTFCTLYLLRGEIKDMHTWTEALPRLQKEYTARIAVTDGMMDTESLKAGIKALCMSGRRKSDSFRQSI